MDYGAPDFLDSLTCFLQKHNVPGSASVTEFDHFDLYSSISFLLPSQPHIANSKRISRIRASPQCAREGHRKNRPQHFDTALIVENEDEFRLSGGIKGASFFLSLIYTLTDGILR